VPNLVLEDVWNWFRMENSGKVFATLIFYLLSNFRDIEKTFGA
jgi:hypothetical protein